MWALFGRRRQIHLLFGEFHFVQMTYLLKSKFEGGQDVRISKN